ncbi:hypothetical protein HDV05_003010 [Chytridiales sp. JEL 0842]|nr:hypothetical protein HDV05_003010 [Chytridiales sp. JEL 0842]
MTSTTTKKTSTTAPAKTLYDIGKPIVIGAANSTDSPGAVTNATGTFVFGGVTLAPESVTTSTAAAAPAPTFGQVGLNDQAKAVVNNGGSKPGSANSNSGDSSTTASNSGAGLSGPAIIGLGVAGGLVVAGLIIGAAMYRRRRSSEDGEKSTKKAGVPRSDSAVLQGSSASNNKAGSITVEQGHQRGNPFYAGEKSGSEVQAQGLKPIPGQGQETPLYASKS